MRDAAFDSGFVLATVALAVFAIAAFAGWLQWMRGRG